MEDYISVREAAKIIGVATQTVWSAIREGRIEYISIAGKKVLKRQAAEAYKARTQQGGGKPTGRPRKVKDNE